MASKKILIITYGFAPFNAIGILRIIKLVKYLHQEGWQALVVAPKELRNFSVDQKLLSDIPSDTKIFSTRSFEPLDLAPRSLTTNSGGALNPLNPSLLQKILKICGVMYFHMANFLLVPDQAIGWYFLSKKIDSVVRQYNPDIIFSSSPPHTAHLIARRLKRALHKPWVADFRDEWTRNPFQTYPTPLHRRLNVYLEKKVITEADVVTSISPPIAELFADLLKQYGLPQKSEVLYNGYDEDDFNSPPPPQFKQFTITYTGNFYGHRSPTSFLKALELILKEKKIPSESVKVIFAGTNIFKTDSSVDFNIIKPIIELRATVPHHQAISLMRQSSALLLVISRESGKGSLTGKIFEYLASGRPILSLAPPGIAADLINQAEAGIVVDPDNIGLIKQAIENLYANWKNNGRLYSAKKQIFEPYSRKNQAKALDVILNKLLG